MRHECFGCCARSARGRPLYFAARARTRIFVGRGREPVTLPETSKCKSGLETWSTTQSTWDPSGSALCPHSLLTYPCQTFQRVIPENPPTRLSLFPKRCSGDFSVSSDHVFASFLEGEKTERPTTLESVDPDERTVEKVKTRNRFDRGQLLRGWVSFALFLLTKFFVVVVAWYAFINLNLKCFTWATRWFKGVCRARGAQGGKQFAKSSSFFACFVCSLKVFW